MKLKCKKMIEELDDDGHRTTRPHSCSASKVRIKGQHTSTLDNAKCIREKQRHAFR